MKPAVNQVFDKDTRNKLEIFEKGQANIDAKKQAIREYRAEASRLASVANKRIERLERNNLTDSPAYKRYIQDGGHKFGVRGKSYNQVQSEVARLNRFLSSQTSTIKGVNSVLKNMAENTGIKYDNLQDLRDKSGKFFELASKVEQYLRTVEDMASAIGYDKIWEIINEYTEAQNIDLSNAETDIDSMIESVVNAIKEYDEPAPTVSGWYSIKKDTDV